MWKKKTGNEAGNNCENPPKVKALVKKKKIEKERKMKKEKKESAMKVSMWSL